MYGDFLLPLGGINLPIFPNSSGVVKPLSLIQKYPSSLVILFVAGIFFFTRNPHVNFGDSLGFLVFASEGFDAGTNATSHFLYNNLNHLALLAFPAGDPIAVLTGLSFLFAFLTLVQLYRGALLLTMEPPAAALSVLSLGLGFTFWRQAVIIEVYTFNCFWVSTLLLHIVKAWKTPDRDQAPFVSLILALALLTHIQNLLLLPVYCLFLYARPRQRPIGTWVGLAILLAISSLLILLPLTLHTHSIRSVFFEDQYQQAVLGLDLASLPGGILRSIGYLLYNYHLFLPFVVQGVWLAWQRDRQLLLLLVAAGLPFWLFAMRYNVSDNYVFFLTPYLCLSLLAALSFTHWTQRLPVKVRQLLPFLTLAVAPLIYVIALQLALLVPQLSDWDQHQAEKGGLRYYLWPGQAQSVDPLSLAQQLNSQYGSTLPPQWNWFDRYEYATRYIKIRAHHTDQEIDAGKERRIREEKTPE